MKPIIYTTSDCHYCHSLMEWLDDIGVDYDEIDATTLEDAPPVVPELHIGDDIFVGSPRQKILKSLKNHALIS